MENKFIRDESIKMDAVSGLDQITSGFQSIKDGLPELVKNSKDQYQRLKEEDKDKRQIVVIMSKDGSSLGVLDFAGASKRDFKGWEEWNSRTAGRNQLGDDIEAGNGNGGKGFMVRGCLEESHFLSVSEGKVYHRGFKDLEKPSLRYRPVTFQDHLGQKKFGIPCKFILKELNDGLAPLDLRLDDLPSEVKKAFESREAFTLVTLIKLRELFGRKNKSSIMKSVSRIKDNLAQHDQAMLTLENCNVWFFVGNKNYGQLRVQDLFPYDGLEKIGPIPVPSKLLDPDTDEEIEINVGEKDILQLKTSKTNLRQSDIKGRNVIRVRSGNNVVAHWKIGEMAPYPSSAHLYGEIYCSFLSKEHEQGSMRDSLISSPLTRALQAWVTDKVEEFSRKIQKLQSKKGSREGMENASKNLNKLRELMMKYLALDEGSSGTKGGAEKKTPPGLEKYGKRVDKIVLEENKDFLRFPKGTVIPLLVKCYEKKGDHYLPVKNPKIELRCEREKIHFLELFEDNMIKGVKEGKVAIYFETNRGSVKSNVVVLDIVNVQKIQVKGFEEKLKKKESRKINIEAFDKEGGLQKNLVYEFLIDDPTKAIISRTGILTAGIKEGNVLIKIKYGESKTENFTIEIGKEEYQREGKGDKGNDFPLILFCGDEAPNTQDLGREYRTYPPSEDDVTIIDNNPFWKNIIWINHESKESKKFRLRGDGEEVRIDSGRYQDFLILKTFEILKRLKIKEDMGSKEYAYPKFINALAATEIHCAGFLEEAHNLIRSMLDNRTNGEE